MSRQLATHHPFRSAKARELYLAHYDSWAEEWATPADVRMITTEYGDTLVRVSGPVDGPPLVLLPAARLHSLLWMDDVALFSQRYRTFAVDAIYDNGRSVSSRPIRTVGDATGWLDALLDALGLSTGVNLMGASLGAWLAAEYVLHAPHRLNAAIWAAPPAVIVPPTRAWIARAMLTIVPSRGTLAGLMDYTCPVASRSSGRSRRIYDMAVDDIVLAGQCFKPRPFPGGPRVLKDEELAGVLVPVLYIEGEREAICSPHDAVRRLSSVAPQIQTCVVEGADHTLSWTNFDGVNSQVLAFLNSNRGLT